MSALGRTVYPGVPKTAPINRNCAAWWEHLYGERCQNDDVEECCRQWVTMFQEAVPTAWYILLVLPFQQTPNVVVLVCCNREKGQMWAAFVWGPTTGHVLTEMYSTCYIIIDHGRLGNSWIGSPIIPHQQFSPLVVHDTHPDGLSTLRPASFVYTLCWRGMKNFFVLFCFVFLGCADGEWKIFHCCDEHRA